MASSKLPKRLVPVSYSRTYHGEALVIVLTMPVATVSEANQREHWSKKAARVKKQRRTVAGCLVLVGKPPKPPCAVHLVRIAPSRLDTDNAVGAHKAVRDQVAAWLGVDDRSPLVTWTYGQESDPTPRTYGTRIEIRKERA
jgi:hypothetical protein